MSTRPFRFPQPGRPNIAAASQALPAPARPSPRMAEVVGTRLRRIHPELLLLAGLAGVLNLWALSRNGFANDYYAAAVRSMSASWHDFLFASMDRSGLMTVDKPPLALWVQALSARVFGYSSLSLLVPQALMGIASVLIVYDLVRRQFGRLGAAVAGLVLALTPITVAISRHNNPDALLILCCVAALWCGVRGLQDGRTRWLVCSGVLVGLGFETKMLIALVVVPGLVVAWLWVAPSGRLRAMRSLLAGGVAMLLVGGAWPALVELTPASARPWVSGTSDNSVLSLIFEYNGFGRIDGQAGGPGGTPGGSVFGGTPGPLRLLNSALGGQAGWLLGFAVVAGVALLLQTRLKRLEPRTGWLIAVGGSFAVTAAIFSDAKGIFHPYYVSLLAPFTAALIGAFVGLARATIGTRAWMRVAVAAAILAGVATEIAVLHDYPGDLSWLALALAPVGALAALVVLLRHGRIQHLALASALGSLLLGPAIWAFQTLGHATSGTFPAGGPVSAQTLGGSPGGPSGGGPGPSGRAGVGPSGSPGGQPLFGGGGRSGPSPGGTLPGAGVGAGPGPGGPGSGAGARPGLGGPGGGPGAGAAVGAPLGGGAAGEQVLDEAISYARRHGGGTIAVASQSTAATAIVQQDADVAGIGGFSGRESEISVSWLAMEVRLGRVRWVLSEGSGLARPRLGADNRLGASVALAAVRHSCKRVGLNLASAGGDSEEALYDCAGDASALQRSSRASA